jgi:XTP/dITP diphosphohydrolase
MKIERIVVASSNAGKLKEIKEIFQGVEIVSMRDLGFQEDIEEYGKSFRENALIKAKVIGDRFQLPTLSDDSGLCVEALGGAPGIYSARFSGEGEKGNRALLLKRLEGITHRKAYFECDVCLYLPKTGKTYFGEGKTYGSILQDEIGTNGFGYDCIFFSKDLQKSFGLATDEEKNSVSHRYRALTDLMGKL